MKTAYFAIVTLFILAACKDTKEKCAFVPDISKISIELSVESLEDSLPAIKTKDQLVSFMTQHPETRDIFFNRQAYPGDSTFINRLYNRFTNPHFDTLLMEVHRVFGEGNGLQAEFNNAFANLKYYYPQFEPPKIQTVITGLENDLFVTDTLVFVGLDYFLGNSAKYRPNNVYDYMLRRYDKDFIVPSVMLLMGIDSRFNKIDESDKTILSEMIAYGKAYYFAKQMLPCTPDSVLIGYTQNEIEGSFKFESLIWSRMVEDEILFSTSHVVKQRYIAERPKTVEVGEQCPGRIGQWVGWQIVKKYMETHPEVTLQQLMNLSNAGQLFRDSGYKPQVVKLPGSEKV